MVFDGHAHESMAVGCHTPAAGMRDFGYEAAGGYKLIQTFGIIDGSEMAFENDAVKAVKSAGNPAGDFSVKDFMASFLIFV